MINIYGIGVLNIGFVSIFFIFIFNFLVLVLDFVVCLVIVWRVFLVKYKWEG